MLYHGVFFKCNEYIMIVVSVNYGEIWDKLEGGAWSQDYEWVLENQIN